MKGRESFGSVMVCAAGEREGFREGRDGRREGRDVWMEDEGRGGVRGSRSPLNPSGENSQNTTTPNRYHYHLQQHNPH